MDIQDIEYEVERVGRLRFMLNDSASLKVIEKYILELRTNQRKIMLSNSKNGLLK